MIREPNRPLITWRAAGRPKLGQFLDAAGAYFERHPRIGTALAVVFVLLVFGLAGVLDMEAKNREEAYQAGFHDGRTYRPAVTPEQDIETQLAVLCGQAWPDTPEARRAKLRGCKAT